MNQSTRNFEQIALSRHDLRQLRKSAKRKVQLSKCTHLKEIDLIDEEKNCIPGYRPEPTGFAMINQTGKEYLAYINRRSREHNVTRWISITALVISALSLLIQILK